ncbi:hybrid sensor histidine kinase/response regulator [Puia dinghuensis]|uniref:histidine kinase n=1 Tax=Puia dinghuensis TaxID=1792502 RepID=A0A8J2XTG5_9BACT|nr:hybrid sensor histidine kinase/response regulator [Puia dinghuensis]
MGTARAQGPKLRFTHLSGEQGLSNSTIEAIYQDSQGFIWIGTRDGLNRYDGHEMVVYRNDPADSSSISDGYIHCIYEDRDHQLWIGTVTGLNRFDRAKDRFTRWKHRDSDNGSLSSSNITSILEDHNGRMWVATSGGMNELDRKTGRFRHFRMGDGPGSLRDDRINCLLEDKTGTIWVGTQSGLDLFHPGTGLFSAIDNPAITNASGNTIIAIREDRQGNIWLGTEDDGLYLFDPLRKSFTRYGHSDKDPSSLGNNMIKCMLTDHKGQVWAGSINGGLNLFHAAAGSFYHYTYEPGNGTSLSQRTISALFEDRQGNLWVGTHRGGINVYSPGLEKFNLFRQEPSPNSLSYNDVKTFCEDRSGNGDIWVGTDGGGLDLFSRQERTFRHYRNDPFNDHSLGSNAVLDVFHDREGELWVSTWGGGLNHFNRLQGDFTRYLNNPNDPHSITSNFVQKTFEDFSGNLWVATYYGGLNIFDRKKQQFTRLIDDPTGKTSLTGKDIVSLLEDKEGRIWIGTDDGGLNCWHENTRHFTHYFDKEEKMPDLRVLFCDSRGRLWVGQKGLYLLDAARDSFRLYTNRAGLGSEFIKGIAEDGQGNLWIATSNGLTQFNPETQAVKKYNTGDGLQDLEFEANAFLKTKDGELYFGGINGFNSFYPGAIMPNAFVPPVYITGFQLSNRKIGVGEGSPLSQDISETKEMRLSYRQSTFSFTFSALNYTTPENNQYAYKMEGLDTAWNYVGKENKAVYTNLSPGDYVFRVKASNNDGVWNEEGAAIRVIITPPFWRTSWFISLLVVLGMAGLYMLYKFRTRLKMRELEEKKREEMRQVQLQFFTNVSHEFRTPLSLILGPLEKMMKEYNSPVLNRYFQNMHRNAQRLLSLIHELMDFGKLESGSLRLCVQAGNLNGFMEELAEEFRDWAVQKEIDFSLDGDMKGEIWFDRQVLEKMVLNLLQNSFKYTKAGGRITLQVLPSLDGFVPSYTGELVLKNPYRGKRYAYIRVADSGIGISAGSIHHLFERYYRITESHLGSGVGLAFVKSLALLHKGDIYVYSERLKGTEIIIGIPVDENDYGAEEKRAMHVEGGVRLESFPNKVAAEHMPALEPKSGFPPVETLLLVEDNDELRHFLKDCLSPYYQVMEAADGQEGLAKAREIAPGMIISDVIMPGMNGFEFCRAVKQDIDTCHIPFLMLTARTAAAAQLEGLDAGADYYFGKPLNMELLLLTIRNRFDLDRKLKDRYSRDSQVEAMELVHSEKDREFMKRLLDIIDSQLSNPDFDIDWLCQEMGMSRTRLYQKIKGISQQSIGDFIRTIRLKKAVQIMTHEDVTLTEVMMRIGIQTQSYFTKAFKKEFGKTPTQFMQERRK